ncbi:hypothetical protein C2G38_2134882 [Gigaspora rosea]|uniref:Uncharacterized protein n=1 Tax=Gigaspora rosea TaxID=44941 RepID=A0A397UU87_9GLOM|nr:hypothetical protein C2G38_2134882 [Gigaspora rosea]
MFVTGAFKLSADALSIVLRLDEIHIQHILLVHTHLTLVTRIFFLPWFYLDHIHPFPFYTLFFSTLLLYSCFYFSGLFNFFFFLNLKTDLETILTK